MSASFLEVYNEQVRDLLNVPEAESTEINPVKLAKALMKAKKGSEKYVPARPTTTANY